MDLIKLKKSKKQWIQKIFFIKQINIHLIFRIFEQEALSAEIFIMVQLLKKMLKKIKVIYYLKF